MEKAYVGLIGLAVMGQNLVMNMANHGYRVAVYNRTAEKTRAFMQNVAKGADIIPGYTMKEFVDSLEKPRRIMIMVKAGHPVDAVIDELLTLVEQGDIIMDCGNSFFGDTIRREKTLSEKGLLYMGIGVSGGEEGALKGPSIMPGGSAAAWKLVGTLLEDISAKVEGDACCDYIGPDGAGHFVKTVHNGIEYGDMQLISESYGLMKKLLGMSAGQMQQVFAGWNKGKLDSYLIEITADILGHKDEFTDKPLVDMILDAAGQKGTGMWTSQQALQFGVAAPTIAEAVFARCASAVKDQRVQAARLIQGDVERFTGDAAAFIADIGEALYAAKICSYAQGFDLLKTASRENGWDLKLGDIAMLWRGGCIIRARFLHLIKQAYDQQGDLENLLVAPVFRAELEKAQKAWRRVISTAALCGVPVPCLSSALSYFDSYRAAWLPANLIQAQRDYFGAHTYQRLDCEGVFHTKWIEE